MYFKLPSNLKSFLLVLQTPLEIIYTLLIIRTFGAETYGTFQKLVLPSTILIQFTSFGINPATLFLLKKSTEFNSVVVIKSAFLLQLPILLTLAIPPLFFPDYFYRLSGLPQQWHYLILVTTALVALVFCLSLLLLTCSFKKATTVKYYHSIYPCNIQIYLSVHCYILLLRE